MSADTKESAFQNDIINDLVAGGWKLGASKNYDRERALYTADCLAYVKNTQPKMWAKYETLYPKGPEQAFDHQPPRTQDRPDLRRCNRQI